mgnify:CR=1 FL=1
MSSRVAKAYANNEVDSKVIGSDAKELIVLVYERLLDYLKLGKLELEAGKYGVTEFEKSNNMIQQGLLACLDYKTGGEIASNLGAIYEWCLRTILQARLEKSPEKIQDVIEVLSPLYAAWLGLSPKEPLHHNLEVDEKLSGLSPALSSVRA